MNLLRRRFLKKLAASGGLIPAGISAWNRPLHFPPADSAAGIQGTAAGKTQRIDRQALVARHNPRMRKLDPLSPLSLGNGEFAFTADITGLQSFPAAYVQSMPLCTMSQWGWHSFNLPYKALWGALSICLVQVLSYDGRGNLGSMLPPLRMK